MQVMGGQDVVYRSFHKSVRNVFLKEGFRGFFQGVSPAMFAASGSWGGYFYFYEKSKNRKLQATGAQQLATKDFVSSSRQFIEWD
jgi:solute carrier family 25 folate transporter 32